MYRLYQWAAFFYIYCILGWIWETSYVSVCQRRFVNRGFLHGPVIPLYGSGAIAMLVLALPVKDNLILTYVVGVVGATLLELVTGWAMERIFRVKYWDYSKQKIQFKGYICLSSSLFWGVLTIALVRWFHSPIERFVLHQPDWLVITGVCLFTAGFVYDLVISAKEALDLRKVLVVLEKLRLDIDEVQKELSLRMEENRQQAAEYLEQTKEQIGERFEESRQQAAEHLEQTREQFGERMEENRRQLEQKLERLKEQREIQLGEFRLAHRKLRRRHPTASTGRLEELLAEVRTEVKAEIRKRLEEKGKAGRSEE